MEETSKKVRHTPGPLEIWGRQEKTEISGFYMIGSAESEITMGCTAYVCSKHDAKLYCAAPSLLEALVEVNNRYASLMTEKMQKKIINAIKLAKGNGES